MKAIAITLLTLISVSFANPEQLQIGDAAPKTNLQMNGIDGAKASLNDVAKPGGLLVIFSCNSCPYVLGWEDRYNEISNICNQFQVGFVLVNSNEAKRSGADSMEKMVEHATEAGYSSFAYLEDANHVLADAFGATKTPDVFLFDAAMNLVYKGAIDDNMKDKNEVQISYVKKALTSMVSGEIIDPQSTKAIGCSIKRIKS